ncbi:MBL fold metallo-hydrolase [Phytoactinopolyspora alkaliphila]|uniref:MBL fold metallo-hydrolase n=1 Tax=Phytoactinopolyspora alkaliphila TaxID=1783498 RepID=A0A6N9YLU2_9ACTN|nr:MBL fold metallo-hydrolase [Phytoactinopolyspora alkaliphila]NED95818.1 MBL fold metallo-hydrolase [Phytoactinopolyspora alkaliphila]
MTRSIVEDHGAALPPWCRTVRAANPGPMTLDGTNTYVLATVGGNVVVDPGPLLDEHLSTVAELGPVLLTLLTHHHLDHCEGAARFHQLTGAPVRAREPELCIDAPPLADDDALIDVPELELRVLHTPGHTADSVCFEVSGPPAVTGLAPWRGLLSGDTVLGRGTTVVAHPDGRLADYLRTLERLRDRLTDEWTLLPAHGPVRTAAAGVVSGYLEHRYARLDEVRSALVAGARTAAEVVAIVYADVDRSVWPAAERTVAAALEYLRETGQPR